MNIAGVVVFFFSLIRIRTPTRFPTLCDCGARILVASLILIHTFDGGMSRVFLAFVARFRVETSIQLGEMRRCSTRITRSTGAEAKDRRTNLICQRSTALISSKSRRARGSSGRSGELSATEVLHQGDGVARLHGSIGQSKRSVRTIRYWWYTNGIPRSEGIVNTASGRSSKREEPGPWKSTLMTLSSTNGPTAPACALTVS